MKEAAYRIQDRLDWRHKRPATHRGYKPFAASYEKRVIKGLPKTAERMAHGWLAKRESLSGKCDRPSLRDGREHGEEIKVQAIQVIHILHVYYNCNSFDLCYFVSHGCHIWLGVEFRAPPDCMRYRQRRRRVAGGVTVRRWNVGRRPTVLHRSNIEIIPTDHRHTSKKCYLAYTFELGLTVLNLRIGRP